MTTKTTAPPRERCRELVGHWSKMAEGSMNPWPTHGTVFATAAQAIDMLNLANAATVTGTKSEVGLLEGNISIELLAKAVDAALTEGTKPRRDALRKVAEAVFIEKGWPCDEASPYYNPGLASLSPAGARNKLTMEHLLLAAFGHVGADAFWDSRGGLMSNDHVYRYLSLKPLPNHVGMAIDKIRDAVNRLKSDGLLIPGITSVSAADAAPTTTTKTKDTTMTTAFDSSALTKIEPLLKALIDDSLGKVGLPTLDGIATNLETLEKAVAEARKKAASAAVTMPTATTVKKDGPLPAGKQIMRKAADVLGLTGKAAAPFSFDVPCFEWDHEHPDVPVLDPAYQFSPHQTLAVFVALLTNQRAWLFGDTGCGKTTLVEQVAARCQWPLHRFNFDSQITRIDLVGKTDLVVDPTTEKSVTKFIEGTLPKYLAQPYIMLFDEVDCTKADVSYVMQRVVEGNGLSLMEDGGRTVHGHPFNRIIATANTQGNGDETGRYQGTKPQSGAFLDRFTVWVQCDYMNESQTENMIRERFPHIAPAWITTLAKYAREHWAAFKSSQILTPLSPRGLIACAMTYTVLSSVMDEKKAMLTAMKNTFVDRANREDGQSISGLIERVISKSS